MLKDAAGIRRVVIACGFVDLRKGIDGLAQIIGSQYAQNPFEKGTLFLFCGRRSDRMKGLLWMGNGFLLLSGFPSIDLNLRKLYICNCDTIITEPPVIFVWFP